MGSMGGYGHGGLWIGGVAPAIVLVWSFAKRRDGS